MSDSTPKSYSADPVLYLYTSLTSGSSHIVTATSRLETILKANRVPFRALDIATDEKARMLWGRRSGKDETGRLRKIPGLVQMGMVIGDLVEIEEWNEYGELKQHVKIVPVNGSGTPAPSPAPTPSGTPSKAPKTEENIKPESTSQAFKPADPPKSSEASKPPTEALPTAFTLAMRQVGEEAAQKAKDSKKKAAEVFTGKGEAQPSTKETDRSSAIPPPIMIHKDLPIREGKSDGSGSLQSPRSTAWRNTPGRSGNQSSSPHPFIEPMQSPNSTAWKSTDIDPPITMHRGSSISLASPEEIKSIEKSQAIKEEDEDDEADEADEEEDDDQEDNDEEEEDDDENEEDEDEEYDEKGKGKGKLAAK